jgi:hypothetical protein
MFGGLCDDGNSGICQWLRLRGTFDEYLSTVDLPEAHFPVILVKH